MFGTHLLKTISGALSCSLALIGCQTTATEPETPALLVHSERSAPKALKEAVKNALGGQDIVLGFDSLTDKSTLIVQSGSNDPRMMGDRTIPKVDYFDLMMAGQSCYVIHRETGKKYPLKGVNCKANLA